VSIGVAIAVALACGLAATARYALSLTASHDTFPWPTIAVNSAGTAVLASALAAHVSGALGAEAFAVLGAGVAGGLTTFSTLAVDAVRLASRARWLAFWIYLGSTALLGLAASWAAWTLTTAILR
jgi:CrcB protein